ncbi:MAG: hypothetical protein KGO96_06880 [Elusimicrobia bacterium]|nr:hypothetical protein [Elusimicrobiota bacterium]
MPYALEIKEKVLEFFKKTKNSDGIGNASLVSREFGIPKQTIIAWATEVGIYKKPVFLVFTKEQKNKIIELRKVRLLSIEEICEELKLSKETYLDKIGHFCKQFCPLTKEEIGVIKNKYSIGPAKEIDKQVVELRKENLTRKEIADRLGLKLSRVKTALSREQFLLPLNTRQKLAYESKLEKNPNAMEEMRNSRTEESFLKQSKSIKQAYIDRPEWKKEISLRFKSSPYIKKSSHTFGELREVCKQKKFVFLCSEKQEPDDKYLYNVNNKDNAWEIECHCGRRWFPSLSELLGRGNISSCGCIKSLIELEVFNFIKEFCPDIEHTRKIISPLELDGFSPSKNKAFELNGLYYHGECLNKEEAKFMHYEKYKLCQDKNIQLIQIFEDDWVLNKEKTKGYLRAVFGDSSLLKINARDCKLEECKFREISGFINENHIQNVYRGGVCLALKLNNLIVGAAILSKQTTGYHRQENVIELARYCVRIGYRLRGGLGKIVKYFINTYRPKKIVSYSDNRWSSGGIYKATGFIKAAESAPSYWYFKYGTQGPRIHHSNFNKESIKKIFSPENIKETEWETMKFNNYDRVWDCGNTRWELNIK